MFVFSWAVIVFMVVGILIMACGLTNEFINPGDEKTPLLLLIGFFIQGVAGIVFNIASI